MTDPRAREAQTPETSGIGRQVDFGPGALVGAVAVLLLLVAAILPWTGAGASGWQVVLGGAGITPLPRLFGLFVVVFGVLGSAVCLGTRRWVAVFVTAAGCAVSIVTGFWAVWSQNTVPGNGPGLGLFLALLCMLVLAFRWASYAISRV